MASRFRTLGTVAIGLALLGLAPMAGAGQPEVKSEHPAHPDLEGFLWLKNTRMMRIEISGPTHLGLKLRQVLLEGRPPAPVDLTVVRDDAEQGTVRFPVPAGLGALSGEVLIRIDVPEGDHTYRLLVSGPDRGVVLAPFSGAIGDEGAAIVATPGNDRVEVSKPGPRRRPEPRLPALEPSEDEVLTAVGPSDRPSSGPQTYTIVHQPVAEDNAPGPRTRTLGSLAGALLLGAAGLGISGGVQESRARSEAVQVRAGEYYERADRTNQAAITVAVLGGVALVSAIVYYYLE